MARKPRIYVSGMPYHVVNRGHNKMPCFDYECDKKAFFKMLAERLQKFEVQLHAYVLMTNHYHLLVTPTNGAEFPHFMQCLGRSYVGYYNHVYERTGTIWDSRYHASLIETDHYLLACYRYIEMNPVRAGIVQNPAEYGWTSYHCNARGLSSNILVPHPSYLALGDNHFSRLKAYRELFERPLSEQELCYIRNAS